MSEAQKQLLEVLRAALWGIKPNADLFKDVDWDAFVKLAKIQTVTGLMLDGISLLPKNCMPDEDTIMELVGRTNKIEQHNQLQCETIVKIKQVLESAHIPCVFMKGQTVALRYPNPQHRQPGDIDFVVKKADFKKTLGTLATIGKVDRKLVHEHHGMAWVNGITVEPHYKVHNYQRPSTDRAMKEMFDGVFPSKLAYIDMTGCKVPIFPPTFESVFLISHMVNHIYEEGLGLRQVIDYATFLNKCASSIDWQNHDFYLHKMRMERAFRIFSCICVIYLGLSLPENIEPFSKKEKQWAAKMMADIMNVGNFGRGAYVFHHNGWQDALRNYFWVSNRCIQLGFVCPSEARWWIISKFTRFFWKKKIEKVRSTTSICTRKDN